MTSSIWLFASVKLSIDSLQGAIRSEVEVSHDGGSRKSDGPLFLTSREQERGMRQDRVGIENQRAAWQRVNRKKKMERRSMIKKRRRGVGGVAKVKNCPTKV